MVRMFPLGGAMPSLTLRLLCVKLETGKLAFLFSDIGLGLEPLAVCHPSSE